MSDRRRGGSPEAKPRPGPERRERLRRALPVIATVVVGLGVLVGLSVLPVRTWLNQRANMRDAGAELQQVEAEVAELQAELDQLESDEEVERLARANFDLVYPGEESYRIVDGED